MDFFSSLFDLLFKKINVDVILLIMGFAQAMKISGVPDRVIPGVVTLLGVGAAFIFNPPRGMTQAMSAVYYAGTADLFYTIVWVTLMNKINLFESIGDLLLKWKDRKLP